MKHIYKFMWVLAVAAMTLTSCSKDEGINSTDQAETVQVTINALGEKQTKTHYDQNNPQIKWDAVGEFLQLVEINDEAGKMQATKGMSQTVTSTEGKTTDEGLTASFGATLTAKEGQYHYLAVYPSTNYVADDNQAWDNFKVTLPQVQYPLPTSFDPKADLLVSLPQGPMSQPKDGALDFRFVRPIAFAEMTLKGMNATEKIERVKLKSITNPIVGESTYDTQKAEFQSIVSGKELHAISMAYNNPLIANEDGVKVYFTAFPSTIVDFELEVTTDKAIYVKTVNITDPSRHIQLKSSHMTRFIVGATGWTRTEFIRGNFEMVTDAAKQIKAGSRLIITNIPAEGNMYMAMKNLDMGKNRRNAKIDVTASNTIEKYSYDVQVLDVEQGTNGGLLLLAKKYFKKEGDVITEMANGYLTMTPAAKQMHTNAEKTAAAEWTFATDATNTANANAVTIKNVSKTTRFLRYNPAFSAFSAFADADGDMQSVLVFKEVDDRKELATPANIQQTVTGNQVVLTWDAVPNAANYTVSYGQTLTNVDTPTITLSALNWNTTYNVSIIANSKEGDPTYKASAEAKVNVVIGDNPAIAVGTIAHLLAHRLDAGFDIKTYNGGTMSAYISGNNQAGSLAKKLTLCDNSGLKNSGIQVALDVDTKTGYDIGKKVTIHLANAVIEEVANAIQIKTGSKAITIEAESVVFTPITIQANELKDYQNQYVQIENAETTEEGIWNGRIPMKQGAEVFAARATFKNVAYTPMKGTIKGVASLYNTSTFVLPMVEDDVKDFKPEMTFPQGFTYEVESTATELLIPYSAKDTTMITLELGADSSWITPVVDGTNIKCTFTTTDKTRQGTLVVKYGTKGESHTLTINQKIAEQLSVEECVFTVPWAKQAGITTNTYTEEQVEKTFNIGTDFTLSFAKYNPADKPGIRYYQADPGFRIYAYNEMIIKTTTKTIKKIEVSITRSGFESTTPKDKMTSTTETYTWEDTTGAGTQQVSFKNKADQTRVSGIKVYYQ